MVEPNKYHVGPSQNETSPHEEIKGYNKQRHMNTVLSKGKNWARGIKTTLQRMVHKVVQLGNAIKSTFDPENAAKYRYESKRYKAVHVTHTLYKMDRAWAKSVFGDQFLIPTANIAQKKALEEKKDLAAAKKWGESLTSKNLITQNHEGRKVKDRIDNSDYDYMAKDGICLGTAYCFMSAYLNKEPGTTVAQLVEDRFTAGLPGEAAGNQAIYSLIYDHPNAIDSNRLLFQGRSLSKEEKSSHNLIDAQLVLAHLNGMRPATHPLFSDSLKERVTVDSAKNYATSAEHLKSSKAPFNQLSDGVYEMSFGSGDGQHATVFIKEGTRSYIFDPNYGLFDCGFSNHDHSILKLLSLYPPPVEKEGESNYNPANYQLTLNKFELES
jgi:hypothetical protein